MSGPVLREEIVKTIEQAGAISVREIMDSLSLDYRDPKERERVHSLLYGELREFVIRDKNEDGMPTWRLKRDEFEPAKGLEIMFYTELLQCPFFSRVQSSLDTKVENRRKGKVYHLDIAVIDNETHLDIEIDGFEHIRADALYSIQKQIADNGESCEIEIDWMDNERSYVDFKEIDRQLVYKWCTANPQWCVRYHEELLWPHDINRNIYLIEQGWKIIRFWNFEIKNSMKRCIQDIEEIIKD